jgi:8-oxo-dGTP diphosphatase
MTKVNFYNIWFEPEGELIYSVITARYKERWILVRHHDRLTWEIPGGHIESYETPDDAAQRELKEETGAVEFRLHCVATYSVEKEGTTGYGRLFFAEISRIDPLPANSEIEETALMDDLPDNLTYPDIQPYLFRKVLHYLNTESHDR